MGTVHDLLEARGKQGALEAGFERTVVEAAALYMGDEDGPSTSFTPAGLSAHCHIGGWQTTNPGKSLLSESDLSWNLAAARRTAWSP